MQIIELTIYIDYIIPANEYKCIFIMTNFIKTEQSQGFCDEVKINLFIEKKIKI